MTTFRCSVAAAVLGSTAIAQAATNPDAKLRLAARAALGRFEIRRRNLPSPGETTIIRPDRLFELPFGLVLVTTVKIDKGSHAEDGALGIYYLKRAGDRIVLHKSWPHAIDGAGFGYPPDWSLSSRFTRFPAIHAKAGWTGQGYACGWSILAELTPSGPVVSDTIFTSSSDAGVGAGKVHEFNGRVANLRKANSFDVIATGTGRIVEHYVFRQDRFVRVQKESRLQC